MGLFFFLPEGILGCKIVLMKWWLIFPVFVLALVQTTIANFNFLLLFVLVLNLIGREKESFLFAFLSGLLIDLLSGSWLGLSSLAFLLCLLLTSLYKRKFLAKNLAYWLVLFFVCNLLFRFVKGEGWPLKESLIMAILAIPSFFLLKRLEIFEGEEGIRLKV